MLDTENRLGRYLPTGRVNTNGVVSFQRVLSETVLNGGYTGQAGRDLFAKASEIVRSGVVPAVGADRLQMLAGLLSIKATKQGDNETAVHFAKVSAEGEPVTIKLEYCSRAVSEWIMDAVGIMGEECLGIATLQTTRAKRSETHPPVRTADNLLVNPHFRAFTITFDSTASEATFTDLLEGAFKLVSSVGGGRMDMADISPQLEDIGKRGMMDVLYKRRQTSR